MPEHFCCLAGASGFRARLFAAVLVLLFLAAQPVAAITFGDIEILVPSEPHGHPGHGYTEYRFVVRHKGKERTRRVTLTLPGKEEGTLRGHGIMQAVSRTVEVAPGKTLVVPLWVPAMPIMHSRDASVRIDGQLQRDKVLVATVSGGRGQHERMVLLSRTVPNDLLHPPARLMPGGPQGRMPGGPGMEIRPGAPPVVRPQPAPPGGGPPGPGGAGAGGPKVDLRPGDPVPAGEEAIFIAPFTFNGQAIHADTPISTWSPHWLAYTRWDGIIVTREDLADLARGGNDAVAVLQALWQYVETGGTLLVLGPGEVEVPAGWRRFTDKNEGMTVYMAGFGRCFVAPDWASANWTRERWGVIENSWQTTGSPWSNTLHTTGLNESFAVVDALGVPVKGLFVLMILFTILIGPLNLVWLTRYNRRIWMLWTVPVASFFTCLAVFAFMVVVEGWQGHARLSGVTLLDEVEKRATTLGRAAFYSPLTPSEGLRDSADTEVAPLGHEHSAFNSNCAVDWSNGQHLTRGWVSARVPAHFMLRRSETRREGVKVYREGNALVLVNRLGADIRTITVADENGRLHEGADIAAGEKATLKQTKGTLKTLPNAWRGIYSSGNWATTIKTATQHPQEFLLPRTYLAEVEGSPFLEQGLAGARERQRRHDDPNPSLVLGIMADFGS